MPETKLENFFRLVTDPEYKEGYQDGLERKPKAYYTDAYLEGYRQGLGRALMGTSDLRWKASMKQQL